jgi:hypothetical protein
MNYMRQKFPIIIFLLFLFLLPGCASQQSQKESSVGSSTQDLISNQIAPTSEIKSIDSEWNEYENHVLGIAIKYPKKALEGSLYDPSGNKSVPIDIIEKGEVIIFSRGYNIDYSHTDSAGNFPHIQEDLTVRTPYFTPKYLDDPAYTYQIYAAKIDNTDDLKKFVERAYGTGCIPSDPSGYTDRPGIESFAIEDTKACPSIYTVGDVIIWNPEKHVAVGYQPGWTGRFIKPYFVDPSAQDYYDIIVDSGLSQTR